MTDTELLNWLDKNAKGYGKGWICRDSTTGRGLRIHETGIPNATPNIRDTIRAFILAEEQKLKGDKK